MKYIKDDIEKSNILCIPFEQKYFQQYMKIYNTCFYEMRKCSYKYRESTLNFSLSVIYAEQEIEILYRCGLCRKEF